VLVLIGFVLGYLASFSAWGGMPRSFMMRGLPGNRVEIDRDINYGGRYMMGYPAPGTGFLPIDGDTPTSTSEGTLINY
jgi:hypothetical protein